MANPLIKLEFIRRFRSPMAAWGIPLVVLLPGLIVVGVYASSVAWVGGGGDIEWMSNGDSSGVGAANVINPNHLPGIGLGMFTGVAVMLFVTLAVLVPAFVGGSIAGERHSQTLQPLQLTSMSPVQIVFGKLVSSLSYLLLAIVCTAPILVIPFLLGGVSMKTVLLAIVVMLFVSLEFAAISLAVSSVLSRPAPAIIVSLLSVGFITVAPFVVMGLTMASEVGSNPRFRAETSSLRFIAGLSPISLGSWLVDSEMDTQFNFLSWSDRLNSVFWCVLFSAVALTIACRKVRAPVERDR